MEPPSRSQSPSVPSLDADWAEARNGSPSPIHRLLVAIVRRAVWDFVLYRNVDPEEDRDRYELATDAAGWLFWDGEEELDDEGRYTFRFICSVLDLDATGVREHILGLSRQDIQRLNNHIKED